MAPFHMLQLVLLATACSCLHAYPIRHTWVDPGDLPAEKVGHYRQHLEHLNRMSPQKRADLKQRTKARAARLAAASTPLQQRDASPAAGRHLLQQFDPAQGALSIKFIVDEASLSSELTPEQAINLRGALPEVAAVISQVLQAKSPVPKPLNIVPACVFYVSGTDTSDGRDICVGPWFSLTLGSELSGDYLQELWMCDISNAEAIQMRDGAVTLDEAWKVANCKLHGGSGTGIMDDHVIHVRAGNIGTNGCDETAAALTKIVHTYFDREMLAAGLPPSGRATVGVLTVCYKGMEYRPKRLLETLVHEALHLLGFPSTELVEHFTAFLGTQADMFPDTPGAITEEVMMRGRLRTTQVTPRVVREARAQFGCDTLKGAELELQGVEGTASFHWEERFFRYDLMTSGVLELNGLSLEKDGGEVDSMRMSVSRVTLAYLEDTGFFTADYQEAGFQKWGWQEGCLFITQVCDAWAAANPGQLHFCSTTQAETDEALKFRESGKPILTAILENSVSNVDRTAMGLCLATELSKDEVCGVASTTYDCVTTDFAETVAGFTGPTISKNGPTSRTLDAFNIALQPGHSDLPGPAPATDSGAWTGGLCAPLECSATGVIRATVDGLTFDCPDNTQVDLSSLPGSRFKVGSKVSCPNNALMCSKDYSNPTAYGELTCANQNHCSGGGECYKGRCYCHAGKAGCDCALVSNSAAAQAHDGAQCGRWTPEVINLSTAAVAPVAPVPVAPVPAPVAPVVPGAPVAPLPATPGVPAVPVPVEPATEVGGGADAPPPVAVVPPAATTTPVLGAAPAVPSQSDTVSEVVTGVSLQPNAPDETPQPQVAADADSSTAQTQTQTVVTAGAIRDLASAVITPVCLFGALAVLL